MMSNQDWAFTCDVERKIERILGRSVMLDHLSITTVEQLNYLCDSGQRDLLEKALNEALDVE